MIISTNGYRLFIARHGETVFNAAGKIQGMSAHTPLTWEGCEQAVKMGKALRSHIADAASLKLCASPSGRALQTLALVSGALNADWHKHHTDVRLREIDMGKWEGRYYKDLFPNIDDLVDPQHKLFKIFAPGGEDYIAMATRLKEWISDQVFDRDMLIITHGMSARVLRALLCGQTDLEGFGAPVANSLSQGSMTMIRDGIEEIIISGDGSGERA
jgi:glucosyl-3-phosphoglycerate phosphatase